MTVKAYCKRLKSTARRAPSPPLALASLRGGISHVAGAVPSRSSSRFGAALARAAALAGSVELRADLCAAHRDLLCAVGSCSVAGGPVWLHALHDTVLKRYRVAAGSARPLRDYHLMHDSSFIHDYRLPRDPSYSTILPSFTTTSALAIPLWKSLPESRAAPTIPPWKSLPESPPAPTHRVPSRPNFTPVAAPPTRHTRARGGLIRTAIRFRADW